MYTYMTSTAPEAQPTIEACVGPTKVTTQKVKVPKRVEAGKRLAQISKEAREKKMRAKIEAEMQAEKSWMVPIIGIVGLVLAGVTVYYARAEHKRDTAKVPNTTVMVADDHVHITKKKKEPQLDSL